VAYPAPSAAEKLSTYIKSVWPALERMGMGEHARPDNYRYVRNDLGEHISNCDFIQEAPTIHLCFLCGRRYKLQ